MRRGQRQSRSRRALVFARNFLKHPKMLGSLIPSSRFLIEHLLRRIRFDRARVIVEYGPGVGTFTTALLDRMRPDAVLVAFETNAEFAELLRQSVADPRLHVVHGSAAGVRAALARRGLRRADYVLSGIPFTVMPAETRDAILRATRDVLRPDGMLLVYQFTRAIRPHLERVFGEVREDFEPLNILPARIFYCTPARQAESAA